MPFALFGGRTRRCVECVVKTRGLHYCTVEILPFYLEALSLGRSNIIAIQFFNLFIMSDDKNIHVNYKQLI